MEETIKDILAEMRRRLSGDGDSDKIDVTAGDVRALLDRIEAAYKREHAEWHAETDAAKDDRNRIACKMRYEFSAKCRACKAGWKAD
jgi:hypothetical protein